MALVELPSVKPPSEKLPSVKAESPEADKRKTTLLAIKRRLNKPT